MPKKTRLRPAAMLAALVAAAASSCGPAGESTVSVEVSFPGSMSADALDGRLILVLSQREEGEPRAHVTDGTAAQPVFGLDVEDWLPGEAAVFTDTVFGFPVSRLGALPAGTYRAQALLNRYETFTRSDGHVVKLPPDRGEGQQWARKPGNLYSSVSEFTVGSGSGTAALSLTLDQVIPDLPDPETLETEWVRFVRIRSDLLSDFWGRDMYLGAWVMLPDGFDEHPEARYPLAIFHGHFPASFSAMRVEPPDETEECVYSARFDLDCYNRIQQEYQHELYRQWTSDDFPRHLVVEIQHPTPYYDDSYAVNSENNGPYGDALVHELIPEVEQRFRAISEPWARTLTGGSTGGWSSLAMQIFHPDFFNGVWSLCPDAVDFRAHQIVNIYDDDNAYYIEHEWTRVERPNLRSTRGEIRQMMKDENHYELVVGGESRSGGQWDIWEATYGPVDDDGYPKRIWDKTTGAIDHDVAEFWLKNYDLRHILETQWDDLGPRLEGKLHIYVGDMDNYYLNNGVKLMEAFLEKTSAPAYGGLVDYGDGEGHCYGPGYPELLGEMAERILATAPKGADTTSWRTTAR